MQVLLHPSDQPVFMLNLTCSGCVVEVRIGDVPVFGDVSGTSLRLHLPVNEWLFQGSNEIQLLISPAEEGSAFGENAGLELVLLHKLARDAVKNTVEIGRLAWEPPKLPEHPQAESAAGEDLDALPDLEDDDDAPLLALPGQPEELGWRTGAPRTLKNKSVRITTRLVLPPPWPVCPWARHQMLPEDQRTHFALQGLLRACHQRLQQGVHEEFFKRRRAALESAYYLSTAREAEEALGFPALLHDPAWKLQPLPEKGLKLELAAGGRLARLLDETTAESPLVLVNEEQGVCAVVDAWWSFGAEWVLLR